MGFFLNPKRSTSTHTIPAPSPAALDPRLIRGFSKHPTKFYKHAQKTKDGTPIASQIYWNTNPPTPCPDIRQHAIFDIDDDDVDVELYDSRNNQLREEQRARYVLNREYGPGIKGPDTVRSVGPTPNYELIRSWLSQCNKEHRQCRPDGQVGKLNLIELIDVRERRLVRYKSGVQYVALSYVWGGVDSPRRLGREGDLPVNISTTIMHAMEVTQNLGISYLWVDAVCIDQDDPEEMKQQLPLMDYIYEQAHATIVALGDDANIGLPGLIGGPLRWAQLAVEFGTIKLLSRCPTLRSEVEASRWPTRGWTYQENLFSRRCIYFTGSQVVFHCNAMLCSEDSSVATKLPQIKTGNPVFRKYGYHWRDINYILPYILMDSRMQVLAHNEGRMGLIAGYLGEYVRRDVSRDKDAIKAFGALLSRLERDFFPRGFVYGIPRDEVVSGLLWTGFAISRREGGNFPSWSWAGWKLNNGGDIMYGSLTTSTANSIPIPVPLRISYGRDRLFSAPTKTERLSGLALELEQLWEYHRTHTQIPKSLKACILPDLAAAALAIDGAVMRLPIAYDSTTQSIRFTPPLHLSKVHQRNPPPPLLTLSGTPEKRDFLVLRTTQQQGAGISAVRFQLMLLQWEMDEVATRAGLLTLDIEKDLHTFWQSACVKQGVFWLI